MAAHYVRSLPIGFQTYEQFISELPGYSDPPGPIVAVSYAGIDRVSAAAKHRPFADVLLRPNREQGCNVARPQALARSWQGNSRKGRNLQA